MVKTIAVVFGVAFLLVGLIGFAAPNLLGFHLSAVHNVVHLATGAVSLFLGLKGSVASTKIFAIVFGAVYLLLGIAGFALGTPVEGHGTLWRFIPGVLEFGTVDNVFHLAVGAIYLLGGLTTKAADAD